MEDKEAISKWTIDYKLRNVTQGPSERAAIFLTILCDFKTHQPWFQLSLE